ncbi:MAG: 4-hydroxy-tetrahydrodipicolinate reductase [Candidatus Latescibacterota bacterium]
MARVAVCGVAGRMGRRLCEMVLDSGDLVLVGGTEAAGHPLLGTDLGVAVGRAPLGVAVTDDLGAAAGQAQVVLDFTRPEATLAAAAVCARSRVAMVVGTTGFSPEQQETLARTVSSIPVVMAPNFSTAMNLLFRLVEEAARILGDGYDVEVVEAHHRHKVDAPSGTALRLAQQAASGLQRNLDEVAVHGRQGIVGPRTRQEIGIHALRAGDLVGDHTVLFGAPGECLQLGHRATSRDAFAAGALRAARYVVGAAPGIHSMWEVLGIA